jgi:trehalose 6-phosphate synthase
MLLHDMTGSGELQNKERLLIVANRLPITVKQNGERDYVFTPSSGGLVTGLSGLTRSAKFQWFGWPGVEVPRRCIKGIEKKLAEDFSAVPIWLSQKMCEHHYNGFSSRLTLPLLTRLYQG